KLGKGMVKVCKYGRMDLFMKDTGNMTKPMVKEDLYMLIKMCMKEIGKMIRLTDMAFTTMLMELNTKENGKMINNTDMVRKHGLMVHSMKVSISKVKSKVKVISSGQMAVVTLVISWITISMVKAST